MLMTGGESADDLRHPSHHVVFFSVFVHLMIWTLHLQQSPRRTPKLRAKLFISIQTRLSDHFIPKLKIEKQRQFSFTVNFLDY